MTAPAPQGPGLLIHDPSVKANIEFCGNEIADRLAKEAAKEAQEQDTAVHTMLTKQDIITASKNSISEKWQHQWENSDRGRSYFKYHPNISEKCRKDFPSKPVFAIITSLRSGFIPLNHYKHLTNQIDHPNCLCGESETVHHYLLQGPANDVFDFVSDLMTGKHFYCLGFSKIKFLSVLVTS
jgi:capsule polysaccharide modification protein KpsS